MFCSWLFANQKSFSACVQQTKYKEGMPFSVASCFALCGRSIDIWFCCVHDFGWKIIRICTYQLTIISISIYKLLLRYIFSSVTTASNAWSCSSARTWEMFQNTTEKSQKDWVCCMVLLSRLCALYAFYCQNLHCAFHKNICSNTSHNIKLEVIWTAIQLLLASYLIQVQLRFLCFRFDQP